MQIVDFFKNLFYKKKDNAMSDNATNIEQKTQRKRKHKLEIQVYEADYEKADFNNGQPQWRPVRSDPALDGGRPNIIEVADKKEFMELQKQYAMCDQKIKVIREIDPFVDEPTTTDNSGSRIPQNNQAIPISQPNATVSSQPISPHMPDMPQPAAGLDPAVGLGHHTNLVVKPKPKIVTIGDIEVKYDGDKVYQKQWMKLTPAEASNFRVVNDSNNKIVSLANKHIEAKRWILVEESTSSSLDDAVDKLIEE